MIFGTFSILDTCKAHKMGVEFLLVVKILTLREVLNHE